MACHSSVTALPIICHSTVTALPIICDRIVTAPPIVCHSTSLDLPGVLHRYPLAGTSCHSPLSSVADSLVTALLRAPAQFSQSPDVM
jgi:hypothetical protein